MFERNKLAIVIGHSETDPGAMATDPINSSEYKYNTELAEIIYRCAREKGLGAQVFTRNKHGLVGCYTEVNEWAKHSNAVCIELHFNAFDGKTRGTETLFDDDPDDSIDFARLCHEALCMLLKREGKQNRGIKKRLDGRGAKNLALCKVTGCLVEPFFGDNKDDALKGHVLKFDIAQMLVECANEFLLDRAEYTQEQAIQ